MDIDHELKVTAEKVRHLRDETGMGLMEAKRLLSLQEKMAGIKALQGATLEEKVDYLLSELKSDIEGALSRAETYLPDHLKLESRLSGDDDLEPM